MRWVICWYGIVRRQLCVPRHLCFWSHWFSTRSTFSVNSHRFDVKRTAFYCREFQLKSLLKFKLGGDLGFQRCWLGSRLIDWMTAIGIRSCFWAACAWERFLGHISGRIHLNKINGEVNHYFHFYLDIRKIMIYVRNFTITYHSSWNTPLN